jgi:hypothetical protein
LAPRWIFLPGHGFVIFRFPQLIERSGRACPWKFPLRRQRSRTHRHLLFAFSSSVLGWVLPQLRPAQMRVCKGNPPVPGERAQRRVLGISHSAKTGRAISAEAPFGFADTPQ